MHMETDYAAFQQRPLKHHIVQAALQIPTLSLVQLDSFKQGLEISSTKTLNQTKSIINIYVNPIEKFSHNHLL